MNDNDMEGAFVEPEYVPQKRKVSKEEFVRQMLSYSRRKIQAKKEAERQKNRIINDYRSENIAKFQHKMHRRDRRWYK